MITSHVFEDPIKNAGWCVQAQLGKHECYSVFGED